MKVALVNGSFILVESYLVDVFISSSFEINLLNLPSKVKESIIWNDVKSRFTKVLL